MHRVELAASLRSGEVVSMHDVLIATLLVSMVLGPATLFLRRSENVVED